MQKWERKRLGEVTTVLSGATPRTDMAEYWGGDLVWVTPKDLGALDGTELRSSERRITQAGFDSCSAQLVPPGSVIMSSRAPIGHLAINTVPVCTNQGCKSFVPTDDIDCRYLFWVLKAFMPQIQHMGEGCTFEEVSKSDLEAFEIPVPPLEEQRRIVARIEALTSRLTQAQQARQAATAEAERIIWSYTSKVLSKCRNAKKTKLGENDLLLVAQPGFACGKKDVVGGVPHLRMNNISMRGSLDMTLVRRIPKAIAESQNRFLESGDVVFNNTNSTELVGKSCIFTGWKERCTFSNHLTLLRPNPKRLSSEWLLLCLRQLWVDGYFATNCTEFIGQSAFNKRELLGVEIPVPPLEEQQRLCGRLKVLQSKLEELRRLQGEVELELGRFVPALLAQAFRGEL